MTARRLVPVLWVSLAACGSRAPVGKDGAPPDAPAAHDAADAASDAADAASEAPDAAPDAGDAVSDAGDAVSDAGDAAPDAGDAAPESGDAISDAPNVFVCTGGGGGACNDNPIVSSIWGVCGADGHCQCNPGFVINPATGKCRPAIATDAAAG